MTFGKSEKYLENKQHTYTGQINFKKLKKVY